MATKEPKPLIIEGGLHVDTRGTVSFVNDFEFKGVERFYTINAHCSYEPRGWVGHRHDRKWFFAVHGITLVAVVKPDCWDSPASNLSVERFVLSSSKPQILHIPAGYATGSINLSEDAILMIFSSGRIEDAKKDDYRFAVDTWSILER